METLLIEVASERKEFLYTLLKEFSFVKVRGWDEQIDEEFIAFEAWNEDFDDQDLDRFLIEEGMTLRELRVKMWENEQEEGMNQEVFFNSIRTWTEKQGM